MKRRRFRVPTAKPEQQIVSYGRAESYNSPSLVYTWGDGVNMKSTSLVIMSAFEEAKVFDGKCLREVLEDRGYDMTTLKFSISKLTPPLTTP